MVWLKYFRVIAFAAVAALIFSATSMASNHSGGLISSGIGEFAIGYKSADSTEDVNDDSFTYSGAVRYSIPLAKNFSIQLDAEGEVYNPDRGGGGDEEEPKDVYLIGGHVSLRDPNRGLVGLFAATGRASNQDDDDVEQGFMVGVEAQVYLGNFTIYGQAAYADFEVDDNPEGFVEGEVYRIVGRWFFGKDSMVEAEYAYGETDSFIDGDDKGEFEGWGIKVKTRLSSSMPIYGFVSYRGANYDATTEGDWGDEEVMMAGVTFLFGPKSLKQNDRRGATLDMPLLPVRAASWTEGLD